MPCPALDLDSADNSELQSGIAQAASAPSAAAALSVAAASVASGRVALAYLDSQSTSAHSPCGKTRICFPQIRSVHSVGIVLLLAAHADHRLVATCRS